MPDESPCRTKHILFVTLKIKSKITRQCDPGQVNINELGTEDTTNLLEEMQIQQRIPSVVLEVSMSAVFSN